MSGQAAEAYDDPADPDWSCGDAAGSRADLAIARFRRGEFEGAAEIVAPVLDLPVEQHMNGIVHSLERVRRALDGTSSTAGIELEQQIESYTGTHPCARGRQGRAVYPVELGGPRVTPRGSNRDDLDASLALVADDRLTRRLSFDSRSREQATQMAEGVVERAQLEPPIEH